MELHRKIKIKSVPQLSLLCSDTYLFKAVIMKDPDSCKILVVGVNKKGSAIDHLIELNVDWIKNESREDWLANVLLSSVYKLVTGAKTELGGEVRNKLTGIMQLLGESALKGMFNF